MNLPTGVYKQGERFRAQMRVLSKQYHLGVYDDPKDAETAYKFAKRMADDVVLRTGKPMVETTYIPKYIKSPTWFQRVFGKKKNTYSAK